MKLRETRSNEEWKEMFENIVKTHTARIYKMIYNMTNNYEIARELTQDVFTNAWKGFKSFRGDSSVYTWLYRIALNTVFRHRREKARQEKFVSVDEITPPATEDNPEKHLLQKSDRKLVKNMVFSLPRECQEILILRYYEDYDYSTISQILKIPIGTVRSRLHRTITKLEELIKEKI
jgi:RNA polymerase sigma-70 factor (ECF subfamily)